MANTARRGGAGRPLTAKRPTQMSRQRCEGDQFQAERSADTFPQWSRVQPDCGAKAVTADASVKALCSAYGDGLAFTPKGKLRSYSACFALRQDRQRCGVKAIFREYADSDVNGQSNDSAAIRGIAFRPDNTAKSGFHVLRTRPIQETLKGERLDGSKWGV